MRASEPFRLLIVLGQKPGMTGSGVLVQEMWNEAARRGDRQHVICAGYPGDDYQSEFGTDHSIVSFSNERLSGELPFPIPGMSDVMPYKSLRYRDLSEAQALQYVASFRKRLEQLIQTFRPDIVLVHHLWLLSNLVSACGRTPCVVNVHGTGLKLTKTAPQHRHWVEREVHRIAHFLSVSRDIAADARAEYEIPEHKMSVLGNGYNPERFRLDGPVETCRHPVVLCTGKFVAWKGFRYIIRACSGISRRFRLVILGTGPPHEHDALVREAESAGVAEQVLLPGHLPQEQVARWMRRADVFVLPSVYEPFGLVLLEAMACGCPIIASAAGGPRDIVSPDLIKAQLATSDRPTERPQLDAGCGGALCRQSRRRARAKTLAARFARPPPRNRRHGTGHGMEVRLCAKRERFIYRRPPLAPSHSEFDDGGTMSPLARLESQAMQGDYFHAFFRERGLHLRRLYLEDNLDLQQATSIPPEVTPPAGLNNTIRENTEYLKNHFLQLLMSPASAEILWSLYCLPSQETQSTLGQLSPSLEALARVVRGGPNIYKMNGWLVHVLIGYSMVTSFIPKGELPQTIEWDAEVRKFCARKS